MEQYLSMREVCEVYGITHARVAQLRNGCQSKNGAYRYPPALVAGRDYIYTNKFLYRKQALDEYFMRQKSINTTGVQFIYRVIRTHNGEAITLKSEMCHNAAMMYVACMLQERPELQARLRGVRSRKFNIDTETDKIYFTRDGVKIWAWGNRAVDLRDSIITIEPYEVEAHILRLCLANSGLSHTEFATIAGVPENAVAGYIQGNVMPAPEVMAKIVKILDQ